MTTPSSHPVIDPTLSLARQAIYRFVALAFADPRAGTWEQLAQDETQKLVSEAAALLRSEGAAATSELGLGERKLLELDPSIAIQLLPSSAEDLNRLYESTFGLLVSCACPPYETEYIDSKLSFQRSNALADISGFYRAFGLKLASRHSERQDHITLELEFMAFLIGLERQATGTDEPEKEKQIICRDAQIKFLGEHLAPWTPAFCRLLTREFSPGFYGALADFLSAWIPAERSLLGVAVASENVAPSAVEGPVECEGCALAN